MWKHFPFFPPVSPRNILGYMFYFSHWNKSQTLFILLIFYLWVFFTYFSWKHGSEALKHVSWFLFLGETAPSSSSGMAIAVKVVPKWLWAGNEKCAGCMRSASGVFERGTNGTRLQLVRSCTLPLNLGVPDVMFKVQLCSRCPLWVCVGKCAGFRCEDV